ncbi:hypothetical protein [Natronomonas amylolytica]|uniref:hypothetical protein n=1 Tax=Natronomonas amylolytica TaxID=3108498 RepID=UPI00300AF245
MIISIHRYELGVDTTAEDFEAAIAEAERRGCFDLPGLVEYRFLRGIKGNRTDGYTAVWTYESRETWEALWGPVDDPVPKSEYPDGWNVWEDDILDPLLAGPPDDIAYTSYEVVATGE